MLLSPTELMGIDSTNFRGGEEVGLTHTPIETEGYFYLKQGQWWLSGHTTISPGLDPPHISMPAAPPMSNFATLPLNQENIMATESLNHPRQAQAEYWTGAWQGLDG